MIEEVKSQVTKERIARMFNNTLRLAIFAGLAIIFDNWWLLLLSAIFWSHEKE